MTAAPCCGLYCGRCSKRLAEGEVATIVGKVRLCRRCGETWDKQKSEELRGAWAAFCLFADFVKATS